MRQWLWPGRFFHPRFVLSLQSVRFRFLPELEAFSHCGDSAGERAPEPRKGLLALPGGFLRYGEDPWEAARREACEEARVETVIERLLHSMLVDYEYEGSRLRTLELAFLSTAVDVELDADSDNRSQPSRLLRRDDALRRAASLSEQAGVLHAYASHLEEQARAAD